MSAGVAWYVKSREAFLAADVETVVGELASGAASEGLHIEQAQHEEWHSSVGVLQRELQRRASDIELLRSTLSAPDLVDFRHVLLEYDFRRRGLRMDCILLGDGIIAVVEFKRSKVTAADRDQVTNYAVNLIEFHEETRRVVDLQRAIVVPVLALTTNSRSVNRVYSSEFLRQPWSSVLAIPLVCESSALHRALRFALDQRRASLPIDCNAWLSSRFSPSSSIVDAAISLYGQHGVSAIDAHAAPVENIDRCVQEVSELVALSRRDGRNRVIIVSGAPGAGKTLVGLKIAFSQAQRHDAVFVTGNSPLVDVLSEALKGAYKRRTNGAAEAVTASGYALQDAARVIGMSTFKLVKAHQFLRERGSNLESADGRIVVFDEAQRTYQQGRMVLGARLAEDEAKLILQTLQSAHPRGAVVIALVGHNQAINAGEIGIKAWFTAAEALGWRFAVSDETLALDEVRAAGDWSRHPLRDVMRAGHLPHSMRFYRNSDLERWADHVLGNQGDSALRLAAVLNDRGDTVWLIRSLTAARQWVRARRVGQERAGIIASGQARRLAAEGLFVDFKPDIAKWMLAPSGDVRSGNMLECVQNQYQVQGLELDYAVVCWDGDLRRSDNSWKAMKLRGSTWQRDAATDTAINGYRVLLTRARKGMIIFVPPGDQTGEDETRLPSMYDGIAEYLCHCGAREWFDDRQPH